MSHITNKVHDQSHRARYIRLDAQAEIRHFAQIPSFLFDEPAFQPLTGAYDNLRHKALRDWEAEEVPEPVLGFSDNGEPDTGFPAYGVPNAGSLEPAPRAYDSRP